MSTDEGENTSNDAGDISSSEASGSGRRRKNKSLSPKSPVHEPNDAKPSPSADNDSRKSDYKSPEKKITQDLKHQQKTSTPKKENIRNREESPKIDVIQKENSLRHNEDQKEGGNISKSISKQSNTNQKEPILSEESKVGSPENDIKENLNNM